LIKTFCVPLLIIAICNITQEFFESKGFVGPHGLATEQLF